MKASMFFTISFFCVFVKLYSFTLKPAFFPPKIVSSQFLLRSSTSTCEEVKSENVIILTPKAQSHMKYLKKGEDGLHLRMGVKSGGCCGMSYVMEFIKPEDVTPEDHIEEYEGIKCVVDPKALLYIYGLKLGNFHL